jgi:ATP-dependent Clp protease ATP-binding subunit ClpC
MFKRFTDDARRAVVLSQDEARRLNHTFIGSEHLLLGVVREEHNAGARALASFGLTLDETRRRVEAILPRGMHPGPGDHIPFTPGAKQVLEQSLHTAIGLGHDHIGAGHIVLGLAQDGSGTPAAVLTDAAGDLNRVRREVVALLG